MTILQFKNLNPDERVKFIANVIDYRGDGNMIGYWRASNNIMEFIDRPPWISLHSGRAFMVPIWNRLCESYDRETRRV
jgi:hypothetical protein